MKPVAAGAPAQVEWRRLAEFAWPGADALAAVLAEAVRDLALPEGVLERVRAAITAAVPSAREPEAGADVVVRLLAVAPPPAGPRPCLEIEVCLFPER